MTQPPVAVAVIGLGAISHSVHLPLIRRNPDLFELTAVVDLSRDRARRTAEASGTGVAAFESISDLLAAMVSGEVRVDGAVLATSGSHAPDVARLLEGGIRVLAEKPLAVSLREVDELRDLARRLGIRLDEWVRVGYMKEYDPATAAAREALADVQLRSVTVEVLHPADAAQLAFANLPAPPADIPADVLAGLGAATDSIVATAIGRAGAPLPKLYTNVVLGSIVHDIGLLRHLVGGIGRVDRARRWGAGFPGSISLGGTLAQQPDVPWAVDWHFIPNYPEYRETVTFHHESGSIALTFAVPYVLNAPTVLTVVENVDPLGIRRSESRWMQDEAFERELRAFAALTTGDAQAGPSVDEGAEDIVVGQRMIRELAAAAGQALDVDAEAGGPTAHAVMAGAAPNTDHQ